MSTETNSLLMCSKCEKNPRADQEGTNPWCLDCRAEYQREYVVKLKKQTAEQAFARGVRETKRVIAGEFTRLGTGQFSGFEVSGLITGAPGPKFEA